MSNSLFLLRSLLVDPVLDLTWGVYYFFARILIFDAEHLMKIFNRKLREDFKYYFADFVRKGGTPPQWTKKGLYVGIAIFSI